MYLTPKAINDCSISSKILVLPVYFNHRAKSVSVSGEGRNKILVINVTYRYKRYFLYILDIRLHYSSQMYLLWFLQDC